MSASSGQLLHTMIRVFDLEKSIDFYTNKLGMKLLRKTDYPSGEFTLAFVGYGDERAGAVIELTYNWGVDRYEIGTGFGHIAIEVPDAAKACADIKQRLQREARGPDHLEQRAGARAWTRAATRRARAGHRPAYGSTPAAKRALQLLHDFEGLDARLVGLGRKWACAAIRSIRRRRTGTAARSKSSWPECSRASSRKRSVSASAASGASPPRT